jgi:hypothetical protein
MDTFKKDKIYDNILKTTVNFFFKKRFIIFQKIFLSITVKKF